MYSFSNLPEFLRHQIQKLLLTNQFQEAKSLYDAWNTSQVPQKLFQNNS